MTNFNVDSHRLAKASMMALSANDEKGVPGSSCKPRCALYTKMPRGGRPLLGTAGSGQLRSGQLGGTQSDEPQ